MNETVTKSAPDATRYTAQQRAALEIAEVSVALSAGAGCGKTSVLTNRYLALLRPPFSLRIDQIVALTFTEKAARELRDRVRKSCLDQLGNSDDQDAWRLLVQELESARISTFHAFCAQILRAHADEAEVDSGFEILDESLATNLRQEALNVCMRRWLASRNPDLLAMAVDHGLGTIEATLMAVLKNRPDMDLAWWGARSPEEVVASWETQLRDHHLVAMLARLQGDYQPLVTTLRDHHCTHAKGRVCREIVLSELPRLAESTNPVQSLRDLRENAMVQGRGGARDWPSAEIFDLVKASYTRLRKDIDAILKIAAPDEGRSLASAQTGLACARLGQEVLDQFSAMKQVEGVLDFNDLQTRVRLLLRSNPNGVRERLRSSIAMMLVDEFQDTDPIQSEILETLAGPDSTLGRLYLVGDVKQSIYRFRGAQPALFETFRNRFPPQGRLNLSENFRSVPGILSFVNLLFAETFPGEEHVLRSGLPTLPDHADAPPCVNFLWVDSSLEAVSKRRGEADAIARLISQRLSAGWCVRDRNASSPRRATAGDVVMLFRSGSDFGVYEQALAREGLEYHLVDGSTYFSQQEVIDMINLLTTLEDPLDALALAGTLRSPIFAVSDEALFWLATSGPGDLPSSFDRWESVAGSLTDRDRLAVSRASRFLSRWRSAKDHTTIAGLLDQCLSESGFEASLMGEFLGDRKRANVRKLVRLARRFDAKGGFTLADFVSRLQVDLKNPPREEQATTTDESGDAVRLMTIHKAKGLEFPIVIVPDLDRQPPNSSPLVTYDEQLGVLVRPSSDDDDERPTFSLGRLLFDMQEKKAEHEEALRCLYVATTRARDVLILSAGRDVQKGPRSPSMKLLAERFNLATGDSLCGEPPCGGASRVNVIDANDLLSSKRAKRSRFRPALLQTARRILDSPEPDAEPKTVSSWSAGFLDLTSRSDRDSRILRLILGALANLSLPRDMSPRDRVREVARSQGEWVVEAEVSAAALWLKGFEASEFGRSLGDRALLRTSCEWHGLLSRKSGSQVSYRSIVDLAARSRDETWRLFRFTFANDAEAQHGDRAALQFAMVDRDRLAIGPVSALILVVLVGGEVHFEQVAPLALDQLWASMQTTIIAR